ncbi:MAG: hypothetical protein H6R16_429 [Proteobacteria bacterium]|nr:hypothetical protein [Pseudomonadota bacterium]
MSNLIYAVTGLVSVIGIGVAIWSFIDTRKTYYTEYKNRKAND